MIDRRSFMKLFGVALVAPLVAPSVVVNALAATPMVDIERLRYEAIKAGTNVFYGHRVDMKMLKHAEPFQVLNKFGRITQLPRKKGATLTFRRHKPFSAKRSDHANL